jgi:hypothetical protein
LHVAEPVATEGGFPQPVTGGADVAGAGGTPPSS